SGSAVVIDRLIPVRLYPVTFWRARVSRMISPRSAKASPSPQELAASTQLPPGQLPVGAQFPPVHWASMAQADPLNVPPEQIPQALRRLVRAVQAFVVGPPVQVRSSARSRMLVERTTILARGMFLQVTPRAKKAPAAVSSGMPSPFSSKLPTGSQA